MRRPISKFARSKWGAILALYLGFTALCSAVVAYGLHQSSLDRFRAQKSEEKITALRIVDAFVTTYSSIRLEFGSDALVPATFRAHSIDRFNKQPGGNRDFMLRWVGREGRQIATGPADPEMARIIESFVGLADPQPHAALSEIDGRLTFRTVYPSRATDPGCVSCHNKLQPAGPRWQLDDVMGAFAIDVPVAGFLAEIRSQSTWLGLGLFLSLALVGTAIITMGYRQSAASEAHAGEAAVAEQELRALNQSLEAATKAKSRFLANMSHEIRTPMNGVFGMADLLLRTKLTDHQYRLVSTINQSAKTLLTVINDILDISRIEAGKLAIDRHAFDIRQCVEGAVDLFVETASRKGLSLTLYVAPEVPRETVGDAGRLRQVCVNLVGNAVKFTHVGEVALRVTPGTLADGGAALHVEVADTGIGMGQEMVKKLCAPFEQGDSSITRRFGGTGLGLSISRHLVELMGGRIDVRSQPGKGTAVHFELPFEAADPTPGGVERALKQLERVRILVIDDRETNRAILCEYLAAAGAEPVQSNSVADGLAMLAAAADSAEPFAAAIVEVMMPGATGRDFLREVAADPRHRALRTVMLTSMGWPGDVGEIRRLGAHTLLTKPVHQRILVDTVAVVLELAETAAPAGSAPAAAEAAGKAAPRFNARVLLAEDNPVNVEVAKAYLEDYGCSVTVVENGREAVEAFKAQGFDLILMDGQMPDLDGLSATRIIRTREAAGGLPRIPIVAVTANAFEEDRRRCLEAGMDDYLAKPFTDEQLVAVLARWVPAARAGAGAPLARPPVTLLPLATIQAKVAAARAIDIDPASAPDATSRRRARIRPAGPVELARRNIPTAVRNPRPDLRGRLIIAYLDHTPQALGTLKQALERCDAVALKLAAHSLKSSSANLGAHDLARLVGDIERAADIGDLYAATQLTAALDAESRSVLAALEEELISEAARAAE